MATDFQPGAPGGALAEKPKVFGLFSMVLFSVSAILVADTVGSSAAMGVQGLGFWIILGLLFFIPYGFVTAELGSAWPDEGGIYVWVKTAFGPGWGTVTSWMYWVNVALWAPSVFVLFLGAIEVAWGVDIAPLWEAVIVIAMVWAIVLVGILPLEWSKFVPNLSAALKVIVLVGLGALGVAYVVKNGAANSFALGDWIPQWNTDSLSFLPIIIYSYMGFELMSSAGGAIKNPKRDVPKMIILAGVAILAVYMFATFGILASIKTEDVSIVTGIVDALKLMVEEVVGGATWLFNIAVVALLFTFFGNMVTWSIGANQTISATGLDDTAPGVFGHVNKRFGTPDYAFVLMGIIATGITILAYVLDPDQTSVFWTLFALSSIVFLIPYLLMFPALLVLRHKHPDQPRPYVIPGGKAGAWIATVLCEAGIVLTLFLFFYFPAEGVSKGTFWLITGGGTILSLAHRLVALLARQPPGRRRDGHALPRHVRTKDRDGGNRQEERQDRRGRARRQRHPPARTGRHVRGAAVQHRRGDAPHRRSRRGRLACRAHARQRSPGRQSPDPERTRREDRGADAHGRLRRGEPGPDRLHGSPDPGQPPAQAQAGRTRGDRDHAGRRRPRRQGVRKSLEARRPLLLGEQGAAHDARGGPRHARGRRTRLAPGGAEPRAARDRRARGGAPPHGQRGARDLLGRRAACPSYAAAAPSRASTR